MEHERNRIRIPITTGEEYDLAPESIPTLPQGEIVAFGAKQFDRLNVFKHVLTTVFESTKDEQDNNGKPIFFGPVVDGKVKDPYFRLDSRYRNIWNHRAEAMYRTELAHDPEIKAIADDILAELKLEYEGQPAMSEEELRMLYER